MTEINKNAAGVKNSSAAENKKVYVVYVTERCYNEEGEFDDYAGISLIAGIFDDQEKAEEQVQLEYKESVERMKKEYDEGDISIWEEAKVVQVMNKNGIGYRTYKWKVESAVMNKEIDISW